MIAGVLAYVPFADPVNGLQDWWYLLLVPLAFGISVIYKALRLPRLDRLGRFWRHVALMTVQIILAMIALAIMLAILVQVLIPLFPAE